MPKHSTAAETASRMINRFEQEEESINRFLTSIIGPKTRKANTALFGNSVEKLRAITASEVEQSESPNATNINNKIETANPFPLRPAVKVPPKAA